MSLVGVGKGTRRRNNIIYLRLCCSRMLSRRRLEGGFSKRAPEMAGNNVYILPASNDATISLILIYSVTSSSPFVSYSILPPRYRVSHPYLRYIVYIYMGSCASICVRVRETLMSGEEKFWCGIMLRMTHDCGKGIWFIVYITIYNPDV